MILADTSAWIEFLRGTGSRANLRVRGLLARCEFVPAEGPRDYEEAAELYRACRRVGDTVRALTDCLIASVAIRTRIGLLHADRDFDAIARHAPLELA